MVISFTRNIQKYKMTLEQEPMSTSAPASD